MSEQTEVSSGIGGILHPPFRKEGDHCWIAGLPPDFHALSDDNDAPRRSRLRLFEDGKPLGPAHCVHATIRKSGRGGYSFWTNSVYFSTSDNSDPNTNARQYSFALVEPQNESIKLFETPSPQTRTWTALEKPLRCAIFGAGNRGIGLGLLARRFAGVEIAWVVDKTGDRVAEALEQFGEETNGTLDWELPFADPAVDFVIVATPDNLHAQVAVTAFNAGKHVFLEKPLATTLADAKAILDAWKQSGKALQLGYVLRQAPFYAAVRAAVQSGILGPIRMATLEEQLDVQHGASFMRRWHSQSKQSGGLVVHKGCHDLDILCWILDTEAATVASFGGLDTFHADPPAQFCSQCERRTACPYVDTALHEWRTRAESNDPTTYQLDHCVYRKDKDIIDNQVVAFVLKNGTRGSFQLTMQGPVRSERRISLVGDLGRLDGIFEDGTFTVTFTGDRPELAWSPEDHSSEGHGGGDYITMHDFLDACAGNRSSPVRDSRDALRGLAFALAAEASRLSGKIINLSTHDFNGQATRQSRRASLHDAHIWRELRAELARWQEAVLSCRLWWRDDDVTTMSPHLSRMHAVADEFDVDVLVSIIPGHMSATLGRDTRDMHRFIWCQHGFEHISHAAAGEDSNEYPPGRPLSEARNELAHGRQLLLAQFGQNLFPVLVPPWNRISDELLQELADLGFSGISRHGMMSRNEGALCSVNTHVDIVDWATAPRFPADRKALLLALLTRLLRSRRLNPQQSSEVVGILTHHRAMEDDSWQFMEELLATTREFPCVRWMSPQELFSTH